MTVVAGDKWRSERKVFQPVGLAIANYRLLVLGGPAKRHELVLGGATRLCCATASERMGYREDYEGAEDTPGG